MPCEVYANGLTICRSPMQPAIMFTDVITTSMNPKDDMVIQGTLQPFDFVWCYRCRKRRWAAYCDRLGGGWYDPQFYCAPGYGCQSKVTDGTH